MKTNFTLRIPKPCHEDWKNFAPTPSGGFCQACQKEVIDFTRWTDVSITRYFEKNRGQTCGRFTQRQLNDFNNKNTPSHWPIAAFLTMVALGLNKPAESKSPKQKASVEQHDAELKYQIKSDTLIEKIILTGVIMDEDSVALPGVNIMQKGSVNGAVSDADGKFMLVINRPAYVETLQFSFIGMVTKEIDIQASSSSKSIRIVLQYDRMTLGGASVIAGGIVGYRKFSPRWIWWKVKSVFSRNY